MPGQVKAIIPKEFDTQAVMDTLRAEVKKFAPFLVKDFEQTTAGWTGEKPKFTPVIKPQAGQIVLEIRVLGPEHGREKWHWLNAGTKPHKIRPKNAKSLKFPGGHYSAGSTPGSIHTSRARRGSGPSVHAMEVNHPGTKARGWTAILVKENQRPFERWMRAAMKKAARESGHAQG